MTPTSVRSPLDFTYPPEAEAFREEVRRWLDEHLTDEYRAVAGRPDADVGRSSGPDPQARFETHRAWSRRLGEAGFAAASWPPEYGGRGATLMEQVVLAEEMARAGAPGHVNTIGLSNIAPAIIDWGTEEAKTTHLPRLLRADDIWCQGFSEPDAGSDLASLRTSAELDGDHYVVNGQKVWTTLGMHADWCELLVRTDPDAPKHQGITCLLVDLDREGVERRPIEQIDGHAEFAELFFEDVRVPVAARLGPENQGWKVAMSTLAYERAGVVNLHLMTRKQVRGVIERARKTPMGDGTTAAEDPVLRRRLARLYLEAEYLKLLADRMISAQLHGRNPGPEGSVAKLWWSQLAQHIAELEAEIAGPDGDDLEAGRHLLSSRSMTIAGGTTQVNKNIVAERILGLPRNR